MSGPANKNNEIKNIFLQHLPERFVAIEQAWKAVNSSQGDKNQAEKMLARVQDLVGSGGKVGLIDISESTFSLENQLNLLIARQNFADGEQTGRIDKLMHTLKEQVNKAIADQFSTTVAPGDKIAFFLRASEDIASGLTAALEALGFAVLPFIHPDDVEGELQKRIPDILIFEGTFLKQMVSLNRELRLQEETEKKKIPTVCLSTSKQLEQRLLALRSGVDAYFLHPFTMQKLVEKIQQLTSPKEEGYRILIIEDDPSQAKFAASILEKGGMKTLAVTEPLHALDALNDFRPDLILMDLYMPNVDGKELTTIIREHPDFITTPIVFLSGEHDTDKKLHALSAGGDDFLTKPIRPKHLISTIANRVERSKALKAGPPGQNLSSSLNGPTARHYFYEQLESLITEATQPLMGGILHLAFSNQKKNQPAFTEPQTETLLRELRTLVAGIAGQQDIVAELDNGIGVLASKPKAADLLSLASKIQNAISHHYFDCDGQEIKLNTSIGICLFDKDINSASQMIDRAAVAAQEAIKGGGEQILIYDHQFSKHTENDNQKNLAALLEAAIQENSLQAICQPLSTKAASEYETSDLSLRLRHGREIVPKGDWRKVAQDKSMIADIDRLSVLHALSALENKRREGKQIRLFIEQSFQSMLELSNIEWLRKQLRANQIVGTGLVFEYAIAELGQDLKVAKNFINELKEMGIGISLSRFGANTAALRVLQFLHADYVRFAIPILKTDRETAEKIVREIHILGAKAILPGVSDPQITPEHWLSLADLQPDL